MNVVDSSAICKYILREEGWIEVRKCFEEGSITFELALKEVLNALWKRIIRKEVKFEYAIKVAEKLMEYSFFKIEKQDEYMLSAFKIASKRKISIYDALFIALAKKLNLPLITSDKKQAEIAKLENIKVAYIP